MRFALPVSAVAAALSLATPAFGQTSEVINPTTEPNLTPASVQPVAGAPSGSCAAQPQAAGCPTVTSIQPMPAPAEATASSIGPTPQADGGYQCTQSGAAPANVIYPSGNVVVRASGFEVCNTGPHRITRMELYVSLQREGTNLNTNAAARNDAGQLSQTAQYDCAHTESHAYRTFVSVYNVADGVGYYGTDQVDRNLTCYP